MMHDDDIVLCTNCDAEFSVNRYDDEEGYDVTYCPFCGIHLWDEEDDSADE
jgi:uncharacterized paraquat-inducible protein A